MKLTKKDYNKTVWPHPQWIKENRKRFEFSAEGKVLGRLAVEIAKKLQGKHNAYYSDLWDTGDYVVVTNVEKLIVTGNKINQKVYYKHTGYKGHLRETPLKRLIKKDPAQVLRFAVKGMLPKNKQRDPRLKRLKIFVGDQHPYTHILGGGTSEA